MSMPTPRPNGPRPHRAPVAIVVAAAAVAVALAASVVWVSRLGAVAARHAQDETPVVAASVPVDSSTSPPHPDAAPGPSVTVDAAWLDRQSAAAGIPRVALDAYATAAVLERSRRPHCGIGWNTLAGVGSVESAHGTTGGARADAGGTVSPPIVGPALDGGAYAAIADTDGGALDGDPRGDSAVGPMQFLPAEWARYAADANGDGVADPENLYDESLAAADYLCVAGGDLTDGAAWTRAVHSYNPNGAYVARVRAAATVYADRAVH